MTPQTLSSDPAVSSASESISQRLTQLIDMNSSAHDNRARLERFGLRLPDSLENEFSEVLGVTSTWSASIGRMHSGLPKYYEDTHDFESTVGAKKIDEVNELLLKLFCTFNCNKMLKCLFTSQQEVDTDFESMSKRERAEFIQRVPRASNPSEAFIAMKILEKQVKVSTSDLRLHHSQIISLFKYFRAADKALLRFVNRKHGNWVIPLETRRDENLSMMQARHSIELRITMNSIVVEAVDDINLFYHAKMQNVDELGAEKVISQVKSYREEVLSQAKAKWRSDRSDIMERHLREIAVDAFVRLDPRGSFNTIREEVLQCMDLPPLPTSGRSLSRVEQSFCRLQTAMCLFQ